MANCAIVGINWGDEGKGRMVDLHIYLPHPNQKEKFLKEKRYRTVTTEVGEVLLPPYPLKIDEEITFELKKFWVFASVRCKGIKI